MSDDDDVELRILAEGLRLEVATQLRSGLEVYHRQGDPTTAGLDAIPPNTPILVTVSHPRDEHAADGARAWDYGSFTDALVEGGVSRQVAAELLDTFVAWANERGVAMIWGQAKLGSLHFRLPADGVSGSSAPRQRLFSLFIPGRVELQFAGMLAPFDQALRAAELANKLSEISGVAISRSVGYPSFPVSALGDIRARLAFVGVMDWVIDETNGMDTADARKWSRSELDSSLKAFEAECVASGMKPNSVFSYVDYADRFVKWIYGDYQPRAATGPPRSAGLRSFGVFELTRLTEEYRSELQAARLQPAAINTYYRHAGFFVRWLAGQFRPGARLK